MPEIKRRTRRVIASTTGSTWAASTELSQDLPRDGIITEVSIRANITATLTAAAYDDWFRRVMQNVKILGNGSQAYLGMSGTQMSTLLSLMNEVKGGAPTLHSNGAGIALAGPDVGSTAFKSVFKFHPGSFPHDPFDTSVAIPAKDLSSLQALVTTTANTVCDTAGTISAGTFSYEVCEVLNSPPRQLMTPMGSTLVKTHDANYSDFSWQIDVPSGAWLRSIVMMIRDDTATFGRRKDDEITGVKLLMPSSGDVILEQNIYELKQSMCERFGSRGIAGDVGPIGAIANIRPSPVAGLDMVPAGFAIIDLRPYGDPVLGINLIGKSSGFLKLGLTVENYAAGDYTTIYWDQIVPAMYSGN
jgi:hypothetical protein